MLYGLSFRGNHGQIIANTDLAAKGDLHVLRGGLEQLGQLGLRQLPVMAVCGASGFVAHPPMNIANATKAWRGHFIYATYLAARRQHLPCSTRSSYALTPAMGI